MILRFAVALVFLSAVFLSSVQGQLIVSPSGSISSLRQAVDEVRRLEKNDKPILVEFQSGEYPITEPIVFQPEDSGTEKAPIIYRAAKGQHVVFTGGRRITGWKKDGKTKTGNDIWSTHIADVAQGRWYFEQLYVGGKWAIRCREPNLGASPAYYYTEEKVDMALDPKTGRAAPMSHRAFIASTENIEPLKKVPRERLNDVSLTMYNSWETAKPRLLSVDFETRMVMFTAPINAQLMRWEPRQRYHIENYKEALDQPGEWFLDRDGTLSYIPLPGENPETLEIVAPVAEGFLKFEGGVFKDKPENRISNIRFEGLTFRHSGFVTPTQGDRGGQSALSVPFSTILDGCRNIEFENCEWGFIGGSAIRFHQACSDCRFVNNYVHDLGANGVFIGMGHQKNWQEVEPTERITVENCIIRNGGHVALGGIGAWIGHGSYNKILHNDISEFYYTGVSVGWQWGYQPSRSNHNQIEFNRIHHLGHWVLSDMGGVYTLGVSPGTTVSNNVIHDIYAYSYGGWGLYTDEGSTGIVMENNLVYRVKTGTFHQHYGKENIVRNNILAYSLTDQIQRSRIEKHCSFFLENNLIFWGKNAVLFGHPWTKDSLSRWGDDKVVIRSNLYWSPDNDMSKAFPSKDGSGNDLKTWQELTGHDKGSRVADPKFKDPENGDFTLPDDSPAFQTGFTRFDYSKAGVYGERAWIDLARNYKHPIRPAAPEKLPPLPFRLHDDFETPRTKPVLKCQIHDEEKKLVRLSSDRPAEGKNCLEIGDSAELKQFYNPHLSFSPNYQDGNVRFHFSMRVRKNSSPHIELRDKSRPYKIGVSIRIRDGKFHAKGIDVFDFPVDRWVRFEIETSLGEKSKGNWNLLLTLPDGTRKVFQEIPFVHGDWKTLDWLGFCNLSKTGEDASFFLDDLLIENR